MLVIKKPKYKQETDNNLTQSAKIGLAYAYFLRALR